MEVISDVSMPVIYYFFRLSVTNQKTVLGGRFVLSSSTNPTITIPMKINIWGCRGSIARSHPDIVRYGGNTPCCEVETDDGTRIVLDMGSGAYDLGQKLVKMGPLQNQHVLLTHTHWDHIQGMNTSDIDVFSIIKQANASPCHHVSSPFDGRFSFLRATVYPRV
jgi:Metallo-beta-lactamase superfamily